MQPQCTNKCSSEESIDGRRDDERCPNHEACGMEHKEVPDADSRTVCLSATLTGKGWAN
jgi:hypothetical protein